MTGEVGNRGSHKASFQKTGHPGQMGLAATPKYEKDAYCTH